MPDKLAYEDWLKLADLMDNVPDPDTVYTATVWHYHLMNFLRQLGIRAVGRHSAYKTAVKLLRAGIDYDKEPIL